MHIVTVSINVTSISLIITLTAEFISSHPAFQLVKHCGSVVRING